MQNVTRVSLLLGVFLLVTHQVAAFGAGNIASISKIEGRNWRHGDIEDVLKTVAHLKGHKWTSMMIKRVYFGNWLRDYSQAVDVGTLKGVQAGAIRILVWILAFMSFGYATREFEVTDERLGVYRPEEHIDNPEDYADNQDARQHDPRLRPPIRPEELLVDLETGMKNYIANERGNWATSSGYVRFSFARCIHFGRVFTSGAAGKGNEVDLHEALRCLGQGLHCLEDFGAHTNYVELALREIGFRNVFPHTGSSTEINLHGHRIYPLVTGTFGGVDFLHSVLGEATDHVTQSEVDEITKSLQDASSPGTRRSQTPDRRAYEFTDLLSKVPGTSVLCQQAIDLQRSSDEQASRNANLEPSSGTRDAHQSTFPGPPGSDLGARPVDGFARTGTNIDLQATVAKIYPILEFRDNVVRTIAAIVEKIPGLESLIEKISEKITLFIMGLLAPYVIPVINAASAQLKVGSSTVVAASGKHKYGPWQDPHCTAPTHSFLSKDHFSNLLNEPAGRVAACILQYVAPRIVYAWEHPGVPVEQVLDDIVRVFHHPAARDNRCEIHENMFRVVEQWVGAMPDRGASLDWTLSSDSVKAGKNHVGGQSHGHAQAQLSQTPSLSSFGSMSSKILGFGSTSKKTNRSAFGMLTGRELPSEGSEFDTDARGPHNDQLSSDRAYQKSDLPLHQNYNYSSQGQTAGPGSNYSATFYQDYRQPAQDYLNDYQSGYNAPHQVVGQQAWEGQSYGHEQPPPPPPAGSYNYDRAWGQGGPGY